MTTVVGKRVLVVEDESLVSMMVEDMLTELGFRVVGPAATIRDGLALAETEAIDVGLLDVNLRSERVDPVAAALKTRRIPIVFATGYGQGAGLLAKDAVIIDKPYTQAALHLALTAVLEAATSATAASGER